MTPRGATRTDRSPRTPKEIILRVYLITFGIFSIVILSFPTPFLFADVLLFEPRSLPLEVIISSLYLVLGFVMIRAARDPLEHKGVIDFVILSSIMHAIIMVVFAQNTLHVVLDAGAVALMGFLPLVFYPWARRNLVWG
jgi:hypothetical protein